MPKKNPNLNVVGTAKSIRDTSFKVIHDPSEPVVFTPKNKKEKKLAEQVRKQLKQVALGAEDLSDDEISEIENIFGSMDKEDKANEKRRKNLDKVGRKIQEVSAALKINDKDKAYYGKKLNKCMKKSAKLEAELTELLKQEQALQ